MRLPIPEGVIFMLLSKPKMTFTKRVFENELEIPIESLAFMVLGRIVRYQPAKLNAPTIFTATINPALIDEIHRMLTKAIITPRTQLPPHLVPLAELSHHFYISMAPPAGPTSYSASQHVPPTHMGGTATPQQHASLMGGGAQPPIHANMGGSPVPSQVYQYHHTVVSPSPSASPSDVPSYVHVSPPQSVTQGNPSSTSLSLSVIPDELSVATVLDTSCHPTRAMNHMVLNMTAPLVPQVLALAPLAPAKMLPPLNDTQGFPKWLLKVRAILHVKRWNGITTQNTESLAYESLSSELCMLLINCLDGDMLVPPRFQIKPSSCCTT
jgi:hypothetical protein